MSKVNRDLHLIDFVAGGYRKMNMGHFFYHVGGTASGVQACSTQKVE